MDISKQQETQRQTHSCHFPATSCGRPGGGAVCVQMEVEAPPTPQPPKDANLAPLNPTKGKLLAMASPANWGCRQRKGRYGVIFPRRGDGDPLGEGSPFRAESLFILPPASRAGGSAQTPQHQPSQARRRVGLPWRLAPARPCPARLAPGKVRQPRPRPPAPLGTHRCQTRGLNPPPGNPLTHPARSGNPHPTHPSRGFHPESPTGVLSPPPPCRCRAAPPAPAARCSVLGRDADSPLLRPAGAPLVGTGPQGQQA